MLKSPQATAPAKSPGNPANCVAVTLLNPLPVLRQSCDVAPEDEPSVLPVRMKSSASSERLSSGSSTSPSSQFTETIAFLFRSLSAPMAYEKTDRLGSGSGT